MNLPEKQTTYLVVAGASLLLLGVFFYWYLAPKAPGSGVPDPEKPVWRYIVAPVGQADGAVLISPDGEAAVIDAATGSQISKVTRILDYFGLNEIETFVLTHPHSDHIGGAQTLFDNYRVNKVWDTNNDHTSESYKQLLNRIKSQGITYYRLHRGQQAELLPGLNVKILNPATRSYGDLNAISLSFPIRINGVSILSTGDANKRQEKEWLSAELLGDVDVLKVGHHGSRESTSRQLLENTRPEIGIISAPRQSQHGHPHEEVVSRLKEYEVESYQTGFDGYVQVTVDPRNSAGEYNVRTFNYSDLFRPYTPDAGKTLLSLERAGNQLKSQLEYQGARSNNFEVSADQINLYAGDNSALWRYDATAPQLYYRGEVPDRWLLETEISVDMEWGRETGVILWADQDSWLHWGPSGDGNTTRLITNNSGQIETVRTYSGLPDHVGLAYDGRQLIPLFKNQATENWRQLQPLSPPFGLRYSKLGVFAKSWSDGGGYSATFKELKLRQLKQ